MDFAVLTDYRVKIKESKKIEKYLNLAWELEGDSSTTGVGVLRMVAKGLEKNWKNWKPLENRDHLNHSIIKIDLNT